ncbi:MAG TPA: SIMPL domain-containing protein [Verrucomicrobiae bacterium]|nr:SIMPL domain-containing protein [Verrucomicrobiae bacterium]
MLAGLFLAAGLVCSSMLATRAWMKIKNSQFVTVKGSARKNVKADLAIWNGSFTVEADSLLDAQRKLKTDMEKVAQFMNRKSVTNFIFTPISIQELQAAKKDSSGMIEQKTVGYRLTQTVQVQSGDVDRMVALDRESAELVEDGLLFTAQPLEFIYTKAGEAKVEMLAEATKDARERAEQISKQGRRTIDSLYSAQMGVFQITPLYQFQTSWDGMNDTSSLDKTITAVVTATFALK